MLTDDVEGFRLTIDIDPASGLLAATLVGDGVEALGRGRVSLNRLSPRTATITTTVMLEGLHSYEDRWLHNEASIGVAWTVDRANPTVVELAGTALVTDLDHHKLVSLRAARFHPYNRFLLEAGQVDPTPPGMIRPLGRKSIRRRSSQVVRSLAHRRYTDGHQAAHRPAI